MENSTNERIIMKRMRVSFIMSVISLEYRSNQHLLNNAKTNEEKIKLLIRKELLEKIIDKIDDKKIELNNGISYL